MFVDVTACLGGRRRGSAVCSEEMRQKWRLGEGWPWRWVPAGGGARAAGDGLAAACFIPHPERTPPCSSLAFELDLGLGAVKLLLSQKAHLDNTEAWC